VGRASGGTVHATDAIEIDLLFDLNEVRLSE
jgi:hypothetical protein